MMNFCRCLLVLLAISLASTIAHAGPSGLITAGWVEKAIVFPGNDLLHAKLDTGAKTSSLHAPDIEYFDKDDDSWVRIGFTNQEGESFVINAPVVRTSHIKRHFGDRQVRPVVMLDICIGSARKTVEVNLVDRSGFKYHLLIGRSFLEESILVDSGSTYRLSPDCGG